MHRFRDQVIVTFRSAEMADLTDAGLGLMKRTILEKANRRCGKLAPTWHAALLTMVPTIATHVRIAFSRLDGEGRREPVARRSLAVLDRNCQTDGVWPPFP
jgi:hypothetical protein